MQPIYNSEQCISGSIDLHTPGKKIDIPIKLIRQMQNLHIKFKNGLTFFGGHPVSMTKQSLQKILPQSHTQQKMPSQSPYLVCEKTDGVRYLLVLTKNKNYMISREGSKKVCGYQVDIEVGNGNDYPDPTIKTPFEQIIEILDGQLILDSNQKYKKYRFLLFDILVHMGIQITSQPLKRRLEYLQKFIRCNELHLNRVNPYENLSSNKNKIELKVKDFFRLSFPRWNVVEFLLKTYIKCMPHQNDGLIFNDDSKQYIFGQNEGYVKWKPPHLNTMDFLIIPNENLVDQFGKRVLDLYLGSHNQVSGTYTRIFYNFTIVPEQTFKQIVKLTNQKKELIQDPLQQFAGVIAQCKFTATNEQQIDIFRKLLPTDQDPQKIRQNIMKKTYDDKELQVIKQLQKQIYPKCWKIYLIRKDKNLPNNFDVAKRIQESIKDNINEQQLIKRNKILIGEK